MTPAQVSTFLEKHPKVPFNSPTLVGYELISADIAPGDAEGRLSLIHMIWDCDGTRGNRPVPYKLAIAENGTLTLWNLPPEPLDY